MGITEAAGSPGAALHAASTAASHLLGMRPELQQAGIGAEGLASEALGGTVASRSERRHEPW